MAIKLKVYTLNCGNGSLGEATADKLSSDFIESGVDLYVLNFQEADFNKVIDDLRKAVEDKPGLTITTGPTMVTHTKLGTQFHNNTGMMSLMIHKSDLHLRIDEQHSGQARREAKRWGSGYNKGGMLSRIIASKTEESYSIDTFSGHLDAFSDASRAMDWANLHGLQKYAVNSWEDLCTAIPDLSCSGYDANTRNRLSSVGSQCAWEAPYRPDMQGLLMAPLGNNRISRPSTYHSEKADILTTVDIKREGRAKGGMLDIVAYSDKLAALVELQNSLLPKVDGEASFIAPEPGQSRDHDVIGSNEVILQEGKGNFDRVREGIACALVSAAPQLTSYLLSDEFIESKENEAYLLTAYQSYLSPTGLLQKRLQLQAEKLEYLFQYQKRTEAEFIDEFQQQMFAKTEPWFAIEGDEPFDSIETLKHLVQMQELEYRLDKLKSKFLNQTTSSEEGCAIHLIVQQLLHKLPKNLSQEEQKQWLEQVKKILLCNQLVQQYDGYLKQANQFIDSSTTSGLLLAVKLEKITECKGILVSDKQPSEILADMDRQLKMNKEDLSQHRDDDFLSKLYRSLLAIIRRPSLSQGAFFVSQTERYLVDPAKEEEEKDQEKPDLL